MIYEIYTDMHYGAAHAINIAPEYKVNNIYLGDIYDLVNTPKKRIDEMLDLQHNHNINCELRNIPNINGNHDLRKTGQLYYQLNATTLLLHGHTICWDEAQVKGWEAKEPKGCGFFKSIYLEVKHSLPAGSWEPNKEQWERAMNIAWKYFNLADKHQNFKMIMGHVHNKYVCIAQKGNLTIVSLPRGITKLEL